MTGRPSLYTAEIADEICARIASGESLVGICADAHMPEARTVHLWIANDRQGFFQKYARAREAQTEYMSEQILAIADDISNDWIVGEDGKRVLNHEHVQRSKLRVDSRKWLMSKLAPKRYGDKTIVAGDQDNPLNTVTRVEYVVVDPNN